MGASSSSARGDVPRFADLEPFFLSGVVKKPTTLGIGAYAKVVELEVKGRKCAGKQLHSILLEDIAPEEKEHVLSRFADECKLLQSIQHPNVVEFIGVYVEKGSQMPCLVMEFLDSTLTAYLEKKGVPDPPTYYNILSDVALGLRYLHQKSPPIVHRDLTANNVLLTSTLQAKISDLGVAKVLKVSPTTQSRMTKAPGTQCYMPPEALVEENPHYDTTIDCFSFGVLMIHMLSAKWPIPGVANKVGDSGTLSPVTEFDRRGVCVSQIGLDHPLMGLIRRCLQNYSKCRPSSSTIMQEIADIQANSSKEYFVCSRHTARNPDYEMSVTFGQEVITLGQQTGNWRKAMLVQAQNIGYIPSYLPIREKNDCPTLVGVHNHSSRANSQLSFQKGDVMHLIDSEGDNWFVVHKDTGMKGFVPRTSVAETLSKKRWFFGTMDCIDGDGLLKQRPNTCGSFLIHSKTQGGYCLAVTGQDEVIKHHSIMESNRTFSIKNDMSLQTLQDLVIYCSQHRSLLGDPLIKPCEVEYGPLQPYCCHGVEEKGSVGGTVVVELVVGERECLGRPVDVALFESQSPECLHSMQLMLSENCNLRQSIQHPNIVDFLGVYFKVECKSVYGVMECLHTTLLGYLEENGMPGKSISYNILSDVALGLSYLHEKHIVHEELSAETILLSSALQAKISDIKVAPTFSKIPACRSRVIQPRSLLKSCYLPPEAHSGKPSYDASFDSFSFGVLAIHTFSARWPVPTTMDHDASPSSSTPQFNRRAEYMKDVGSRQMRELVCKCLDDIPDTRPNMSTVVKRIHLIMRGQISVKEYTAISSYKANMPYELDVAVGVGFLAYRHSVNGLLKTQSVGSHKLGYIPFDVVTDKQLENFENKADLHKRLITGHECNVSNSSVARLISPTPSILPRKASRTDNEMSCSMRECSVLISPTSPNTAITSTSKKYHKNLSTSGCNISSSVEHFNYSETLASEACSEEKSTPSQIFNEEETLEPLIGMRIHNTLSCLSKKSSNPAISPPEASSTPRHPEVHIAGCDYGTTDRDQLHFKKSITVPCKDEELQSTEKGENFVEEKNGLEADAPPPSERWHRNLDTNGSEVSLHEEDSAHTICSTIPLSESCNERHGKCSEMSLNMEEILEPLQRLRVYSRAKKSQPPSEMSSDPAATQSEAPSSQPSPEVYVGKYDYSATDSDQLSFKKGDILNILSKDSKWWSAQLQSTGERGKIPSNFIVKKDSLEAEEWFFRTLQRNEAENLLMRDFNSYGSFLVRESQSNPGQYSLSVRGEKKVSHYLIEKKNDDIWSLAEGDRFKSIPELIVNYSQETGSLCARLQAPCLVEEPLSMKIEKATYECELNRCDIVLLHKVRQARFGEVWEGQWKQTTAVTVVTIKSSTKSPQEMILEAAQMKKLQHPYVVKLIGTSTEEDPLYAVIELPKQGDLLTYLKGSGQLLEQRELVDMAVQVAGGMACLEEQNMTHQNLAARNVLLGEDMTCKVANFGLARTGYEEQAIRWRAPEIVKRKRFTIKSDVWSYGIVLYEIITCGQLPYPTMTTNQVCDALQSGYRMPQPSWCPDKLYSLMLNCWAEEPGNRLGFDNQMFQLTKLTKYYI